MTPKPASARNLEILERFDKGEALNVIGKHFGLTQERIRQIVARHRSETRRSMVAAKWAEMAKQIRERPMLKSEARALFPQLNDNQFKDFCYRERFHFLPDAKLAERKTRLAELAQKVLAGASITKVVGKSYDAALLAKYMDDHGLARPRRNRRNDFSHRPAIVLACIEMKMNFSSIARAFGRFEKRNVARTVATNWIDWNMPEQAAEIRTYKKIRVQPRLAIRQVSAPANIIVLQTVRETAIANYGKASASRIAAAIGATRNSIIGHWYRHRRATS